MLGVRIVGEISFAFDSGLTNGGQRVYNLWLQVGDEHADRIVETRIDAESAAVEMLGSFGLSADETLAHAAKVMAAWDANFPADPPTQTEGEK